MGETCPTDLRHAAFTNPRRRTAAVSCPLSTWSKRAFTVGKSVRHQAQVAWLSSWLAVRLLVEVRVVVM